jgi:protein TonB
MPRLRITTGLSVLTLAIGIAATGWLSTLTSGWQGPIPRSDTLPHASLVQHALPARMRRHGPISVVQEGRAAANHMAADLPAMRVAALAPAPELVPLAMPGDTSQSWDTLRGHLDGRVVLHVDVDGSGRVSAASLAVSSGDPILDEHALRSARGWRFAVPVDHPDGLSGELPMRFFSRAGPP